MAATTSSSTVDLSRLAPPTLVEQLDYETILARKIVKVQALLPSFDATIDSDPAVKVLQLAAYDELLLRQDFNDRALQLLVAYSTGKNLIHLAAPFGVTPLIITPADDATGTAAVYEDDEALRQRIVLAPEGFSSAGPELAYVFHAKSASSAVLDASATSPAPGEVLVSVLSTDGDGTASTELIATVAAIVNAPGIRPLGDAVTVASAEIVQFQISLALTSYLGPDLTLVLATARTNLDAYLAANHKLGRDITLAGIIAAVKVEGVQNVAVLSPAADVVCDLTQAANCSLISIAFAGYGE